MYENVARELGRSELTSPSPQLCPPTHQLTTWAAQMFVSRRRILANPPSKYRKLLDLLEAPPGHWVYEEGADCGSSDGVRLQGSWD